MRTDQAGVPARAARAGEGGRKLPGTVAGVEVRTADGGRTKPEAMQLMEAAVERNNMLCAYQRVVKNQGAQGGCGLRYGSSGSVGLGGSSNSANGVSDLLSLLRQRAVLIIRGVWRTALPSCTPFPIPISTRLVYLD